ncbi:MAG: prepilin-type N-terminal cleavage/methylation domain-containing protein [Rhodoferax sp.]|nr:prepilin-type N-terminal cleavage/methylation domain-containing protein [Rhodoferax sp.]
MKRRSVGFTLVEVLVVLVIGSLVSALLFQMLAQTYRLRSRFSEQLSESQAGRMRADWLRQALRGLESLTANAPSGFAGQSTSLKGLTSAPIGQRGASFRDFRLEWSPRASGWELRYADGGAPWLLWAAGEAGRPGFRYLDDQGGEHTQWPPPGTPPSRPVLGPVASVGQPAAPSAWRQLPAAVVVSWYDLAGHEQVLLAAIGGDQDAKRQPLNLQSAPQ